MKPISEFQNDVEFLLTDIDDTMTDHGQLGSESYQALWSLHHAGIKVVPITGRPAGWCEMIARFWPVAGIVGENGGFYFRYHNKKMQRHFIFDENTQIENRKKLDKVQTEILQQIPGAGIASDQFCRLMDLAVDFCEDVPALNEQQVQQIVSIFKKHGAQAKISSIHVNGWFGEYDKLSMTLEFLKREFGLNPEQAKQKCAFIGDSPNDEPMFAYFPNSIAVANINKTAHLLKSLPTFVTKQSGGLGFAEMSQKLLSIKK